MFGELECEQHVSLCGCIYSMSEDVSVSSYLCRHFFKLECLLLMTDRCNPDSAGSSRHFLLSFAFD